MSSKTVPFSENKSFFETRFYWTDYNTRLNHLVSGPLSRQVRALRMTVGPRAVQSKKRSNQLTWERKGSRWKQWTLSRACLWKSLTHVRHVALATRVHVREFTSDIYYVLTLSPWLTPKLKHKVTIYRHYKNAHTQMIKSWRDRE